MSDEIEDEEEEIAVSLRETIRRIMDAKKAKSKGLKKMTAKYKASISKGGYREFTGEGRKSE